MRIRKLPSGTWQVSVPIGKDGSGKYRYKTFTDKNKSVAIQKAMGTGATTKYPRYVYAIQHNTTGRIYVGSADNIQNRYKSHLSLLRRGKHKNKEMQHDFNGYGDNYSVFVLDEIKSIEDSGLENKWMDKLRTYDTRIGYNHADPHYRNGREIQFVSGTPIPNKI